MGNGNQDTQSWFHSAEVNILVESPPVCEAWMECVRRGQNTGIYGKFDTRDGVWRWGARTAEKNGTKGDAGPTITRGKEGEMVDGALGPKAGSFS